MLERPVCATRVGEYYSGTTAETHAFYSVVTCSVVGLLAFTVGILIGSFGINTGDEVASYKAFDGDATGFLINNIDNNRIRSWLKEITKDPHVGGTDEEEKALAGMIENHMIDSGLKTKVSEYEVLLSYPKREDGLRNYVAMVDKNGNIKTDTEVLLPVQCSL